MCKNNIIMSGIGKILIFLTYLYKNHKHIIS